MSGASCQQRLQTKASQEKVRLNLLNIFTMESPQSNLLTETCFLALSVVCILG